MKKIVAVCVALLAMISLLVLSGCEVSYDQAEVDSMIADSVAEAQAVKDSEYQGQLDALNEQMNKIADELEASAAEKEALELELSTEAEEFVGEEITVSLNGNFKAVIKDNDLTKLFDGIVEFDGDDYDAEEVINFKNSFEVLTSAREDSEFGAEAYIGATAKEAISYKLVLNDLVNKSLITDDEKLEIPFLGTTISIVKVINSGEITILLGDETYLNAGESITVDGKVITLVKTGTNGAVVDVDGIQAMLITGKTEKVNGIQINLKDVFNDDGVEFDSASLIVGEDIQMTIADADDFELFGKCEDECFFEWAINIGNKNQYVGIRSNEIQDDLDRDFPPVKVGNSIFLPNDYVEINFAEVTEVDYMSIELSFDKVYADDELATDLDAVILKSGSADGFLIGNEESDELYIGYNGTVVIYYLDDDNKIIDATGKSIKVVNDDFKLVLTAVANGGFTVISIGDIDIKTKPNAISLGANAEEAEANEVIYDLTKNVGTSDSDVLCDNGVIIEDVENNADNDEVVLQIPSEEVEATITIA